jgi:hypothetical protein
VLIPRTMRRFIARLLAGVMVFAQMAVAAYGCTNALDLALEAATPSGMAFGMAGAAMTGATDGYAGHGMMDPAQPNLCAAHCQSGQQNAAGKPAPEVPITMPVSLYPQAPLALPSGALLVSTARDGPPPMADPPHALLHCCYRI